MKGPDMHKSGPSRRGLLSAGATIGSAIAIGSETARSRTYSGEVPWQPATADAPEETTPGPFQFFNSDEAAFIDAAVARLIPSDDLGPGAKEAGVTFFLDRQLAGPYGRAQTWYMMGPWRKGEKTQGYQSRLTPAQLYRTAIKGINDYCRNTYSGQVFANLDGEHQDAVLSKLESGEVNLNGLGPHPIEVEGATSDTFFAQLMQNTVEGFFSDPIYGGNKDMVGWKLIGFPGAHYDYRPYVAQHGKKLDIAPVGIKGRPGWTPKS
jgi:gluconate 2-dehydrogenase gamma chain